MVISVIFQFEFPAVHFFVGAALWLWSYSVYQLDYILNFERHTGNTSCDGRTYFKRIMDANKVRQHSVEQNHLQVALEFLGKSVHQGREAAYVPPAWKVLGAPRATC